MSLLEDDNFSNMSLIPRINSSNESEEKEENAGDTKDGKAPKPHTRLKVQTTPDSFQQFLRSALQRSFSAFATELG